MAMPFQTFHEAVKIQSVRAEKLGVSPAVIVGVGYPIEGAFSGKKGAMILRLA